MAARVCRADEGPRALNQKDLDTGALGFYDALAGEPRTYGIDATLRFRAADGHAIRIDAGWTRGRRGARGAVAS